MDSSLGKLVNDLHLEMEGIATRGIKIVPVEQIRWLKSAQSQLAEMGAHFLAEKILNLIEALEDDDRPAHRMYDLLTTIKVFERVLTLKQASDQLRQLLEFEEDQQT